MGDSAQKIWVTVDGQKYLVEVGDLHQRPVTVIVDGSSFEIDLDYELDDTGEKMSISSDISIQTGPSFHSIPAGTVCEVTSPMPGDIVQILVKAGQKVKQGDPLCVLNAMKMKNTIHAPQAGIVSEIGVQEGQSVEYGVVLFKFS
jgi:biotin carboxyl carrier protein